MRIKARPTTYKGIEMRSRLEASFAEYLDGRGTTWEYEPRCFADGDGQYLPDFKIGNNAYIEIKPMMADHRDALDRMHRIIASDPIANLSVFTRTPHGWRVWANCSPLADDPNSDCTCDRRRWSLPT